MIGWLLSFVGIGLVGVLLHEATHALTAHALGVPITDISLIDLNVDVGGEEITLEHYMIGAMPLIVGCSSAMLVYTAQISIPIVYLGGWGAYTFGGVPNDFRMRD